FRKTLDGNKDQFVLAIQKAQWEEDFGSYKLADELIDKMIDKDNTNGQRTAWRWVIEEYIQMLNCKNEQIKNHDNNIRVIQIDATQWVDKEVTEEITFSQDLVDSIREDKKGIRKNIYKDISYEEKEGLDGKKKGYLKFRTNQRAFMALYKDKKATAQDRTKWLALFSKYNYLDSGIADNPQHKALLQQVAELNRLASEILDSDDFRFNINKIAQEMEKMRRSLPDGRQKDSQDIYNAVLTDRYTKMKKKLIDQFADTLREKGNVFGGTQETAEITFFSTAETKRQIQLAELVDALLRTLADGEETLLQATNRGTLQQTNNVMINAAALDGHSVGGAGRQPITRVQEKARKRLLEATGKIEDLQKNAKNKNAIL
ncbi:hypothetical protein NO1_2277, partial [Candidatus Termititenax aidoneus]